MLTIFRIASFAFIFLFVFSIEDSSAVNVETGQALFFQYCSPCHNVDTKLIGPALRDADKRHPEDWLIKWIRNNQALRVAGDKDAIALFNGYNMEMPPFTYFSDDQIKSIMVYVDSRPLERASLASTDKIPASQLYLFYAVAGFFLIIIILLLRTNILLVHHLQEVMHENKINQYE